MLEIRPLLYVDWRLKWSQLLKAGSEVKQPWLESANYSIPVNNDAALTDKIAFDVLSLMRLFHVYSYFLWSFQPAVWP